MKRYHSKEFWPYFNASEDTELLTKVRTKVYKYFVHEYKERRTFLIPKNQ